MAGVIVLLAAGTTTVTVKEIQRHKIDDSAWDTGVADTRILDKVPHIVRIIPTKFPNVGGWASTGSWKVLGVGGSVKELVDIAYKGRLSRTIFPESLPEGRYDFIANLSSGNDITMQNELKKQFGIIARHEMIITNVLFLKVKNSNAPGLKSTTSKNGSSSANQGHLQIVNMRLASFASILESQTDVPVVDQTGLNGKFDMDLRWDSKNDSQHENLKQALADQLGLELVPGTAPVNFLVVEKAK